jgi:SAM-dependent methyltransferase
MINWNEYNKKAGRLRVNPLLIKACKKLKKKNAALDLGCGSGKESFFLEKNFKKVIALDKNNDCREFFEGRRKIEFVCCPVEHFDLGRQKFDLVNAKNFLSFISPSSFSATFKKIMAALTDDGFFVGNVLGADDEWNINPEMDFLTEKQLRRLFEKNEIIEFQEIRKKITPVLGKDKFEHSFNFVVKKVREATKKN